MRKRTLLISSFCVLAFAGWAAAQNQGIRSIIGNVFLQDDTPGIAQIGHANIKGTFRAGQVNVTSVNATIPVIGNNNATDVAGVGASFSSAGKDGVGVRGTAVNLVGFGYGVYGESRSSSGVGVQGTATKSYGVEGRTLGTNASNSAGVRALSQSLSVPSLHAWNLVGGLAVRFDGDIKGFNSQGEEMLKTSFSTSGSGFRIQGEDTSDFVAMTAVSNRQQLFLERNSNLLAQLLIGDDGVGRVIAQVKNFVQPDPDDPKRDIVYACVEGPEAAAYVRGTARLSGGAAHVTLPRHFQNVSVNEGLTVQLTPLSGDSEGLAIVKKSNTGFDVRELRRGRGTYEFDWEVKAVRRGLTGYKVYRPWDETLSADTDRNAAMAGRLEHARSQYGIAYQGGRP